MTIRIRHLIHVKCDTCPHDIQEEHPSAPTPKQIDKFIAQLQEWGWKITPLTQQCPHCVAHPTTVWKMEET